MVIRSSNVSNKDDLNFDFREEPFYDIQLNVKGKKDSKFHV